LPRPSASIPPCFTDRSLAITGQPAEEIVATTLSESAGYEAIRGYLSERGPIDSLFCVSDALALGAYRAIKDAGLLIPDDVAVIGVGDYEIAPLFDPPLSSVGVSHQELAKRACRLLLEQLVGRTPARRQVRVAVGVELRKSSGHLR